MAWLAKIRASGHHRLLMNLANNFLDSTRAIDTISPEVAIADFAAYAFGCARIRLDEADATDYLNAALVARGLPRLDTDTAA